MYLVHAMIGGRGFRCFVLMLIGKIVILAGFPQLQANTKLIRRYEGWYYTRLVSYYIIFHFETDWSRIRPLPSTTLRIRPHKLYYYAYDSNVAISFLFLINRFCSEDINVHVKLIPRG